jgi:asparagine synthase (glutamine-hydrolysing)
VHHHDQPFGDSSAIPMWYLAEMTKRHVTVALTGDGGDELFAGYERFLAGSVAARLPARLLLARVARTLPATGRLAAAHRFGAGLDRGMPDLYREWVGYVGEQDALDLAGPDDYGVPSYRATWDESRGRDVIDRLLRLNVATYLLDDLLPKADRMSMAHALEVRAPMLDHELAALAFSLPSELKASRRGLKRVLKEAGRGLVPDDVLSGSKKGFGVPVDRWFREDLGAYVDSMLGAPSARVRTRVDPAALDRLLGEHRGRRRDHGHAIWTLLTLEVFLRRHGW